MSDDNDAPSGTAPTITSNVAVYETPWFSLREVKGTGFDSPYYFLDAPDYVTVLPLTRDQRVVLIRQYRPALGGLSLELPGGNVDPGEAPEASARRELLEETGLEALEFQRLGTLAPNSGRNSNQFHTFIAQVDLAHAVSPERGIERVLCDTRQLFEWIAQGKLRHALDLAVIAVAVSQGRISAEP